MAQKSEKARKYCQHRKSWSQSRRGLSCRKAVEQNSTSSAHWKRIDYHPMSPRPVYPSTPESRKSSHRKMWSELFRVPHPEQPGYLWFRIRPVSPQPARRLQHHWAGWFLRLASVPSQCTYPIRSNRSSPEYPASHLRWFRPTTGTPAVRCSCAVCRSSPAKTSAGLK